MRVQHCSPSTPLAIAAQLGSPWTRLTGALLQAQIDEANPLVKEWALWGVRNLSANAAVKKTIEALQAQGVAASDVLQEAGYDLHINQATNRPRLVKMSPDRYNS